jgi:hypothetical protein
MVGHDGNALSIDMHATIEERLSRTKPIFTKWLNHIHDENRKKYYPPFEAEPRQPRTGNPPPLLSANPEHADHRREIVRYRIPH